MSEIAKDKRRAARRKRNLIAKELKTNRALAPKVIEPKKKKRENLSIKDVERLMDEYWNTEEAEGGAVHLPSEDSKRPKA